MLHDDISIVDRYTVQTPVDPWQAGLILLAFACCAVLIGVLMRRYVEGIHSSPRWNILYGALTVALIILGPLGLLITLCLWLYAIHKVGGEH